MIPIIDYSTLYQTSLTILSAIITGGFVLVFVEIGNRKNRENDKYETEFRSYMHKFSAYLRLMSWCKSRLEYPKKLDEHEEPFKALVDEMSSYWQTNGICSFFGSVGTWSFDFITLLEIACFGIADIDHCGNRIAFVKFVGAGH